jgi:DNA polymerase-1
MEKFIIIDANSLIHRLYHALPYLTSPDGKPINAVYGLTNVVLKIINEEKPDYIAACFDTPEPTFRHKISIEYKATRPKIADDLKIQIPIAKKLFENLNIPIIEKSGYEADDLIGALIEKNKDKKNLILSGDLDTLQLVDKNTNVIFLKKGIREVEVYDEKKVIERFSIEPKFLPDLKALMGDASDNIIGLKGVGEKTAENLIKKFGDIEDIIEAAEKKLISEPLRSQILENKERLILNKELAKIDRNVEIDKKIEKFEFKDKEKLINFLKELGFKSILERILKEEKETKPIAKIGLFEKKLEFLKKIEEEIENPFLIIYNNKIYLKEKNSYELDINYENFKKILEGDKIITFDLKEVFKNYLSVSQNKNEEIKKFNPEKFFDLKIGLWLTTNLTKITIEKFVNYYSTQILKDKDCVMFLLENFRKIYEELDKKIKELELEEILDLDQKTSLFLGLMEYHGIYIDKERLKKFKENLKNELDFIKEEIYKLAGRKFNINSPIELRKVLFYDLKIPTKGLAKTPKGEISTQESELMKIKNEHPIIEKILEYREKYKILTTFTESLIKSINKETNRLHTIFDITGTATGRLASFEPNLQNIPKEGELAKKIRECFVAEDNYKFLALDYSQIELRIAGEISKDENLLGIFEKDLDIHSTTAKILFKEENERTRRLAKTINFGILYGISPKGLKERTGLSLSEAKNLIENYFKKFPGIKKMIDDLIEKAKTYGYAETLFKRKRFIPEICSRAYNERLKGERIAINTPIQGTAADIMKKSMVKIFDFIIKNNYFDKIRPILQIHDELIFEVKEDIINIAMSEIKKIMEDFDFSVKLKTKVSLGKNLGEL